MPVHSDINYGVFLGGDPRNFSPDPECSTEREREAHAAACKAIAEGRATPDDFGVDYCGLMRSLGFPDGPGFGLGVNSIEYPCTGDGCECCKYLGPPDDDATEKAP